MSPAWSQAPKAARKWQRLLSNTCLARKSFLILSAGDGHEVGHCARYYLIKKFHIDLSVIFDIISGADCNTEVNLGSLGLLLLLYRNLLTSLLWLLSLC